VIVLGWSGVTRDSRSRGGARSPLARAGIDFDGLFEFRDGEAPLPWFPLGFFGHDPAAALVVDGEVVACAAEERFTRAKHGLNLAGNTLLPVHAARWCLEEARVRPQDVDAFAHYCRFDEQVVARRLDLLRPALPESDAARVRDAYAAVHDAMLGADAVLAQCERVAGLRPPGVARVRHHIAHAASAFHPSGFDEALVLTLDGTGELESSILAIGRRGHIEEIRGVPLPTSLGTLYLLATVHLGFRSLGDEFKVMGLAGRGDPARFRPFFEEIVRLGPEGVYATPALAAPGLRDRMVAALGPPRRRGEPIEARHADVAAALQESLERAVLHTLRHARELTGQRRLCLAGGVALNCVLNGAIARSGLFDEIFVQPAASDEGAAVGAALHVWHEAHPGSPGRPWRHASLGPSFADAAIRDALERHLDAVRFREEADVADAAAGAVAQGRVVGWFQGRMEFGPRALGNRSILADARDPAMKDRVNALVKRRESFRPFAPAVPEEDASAWFDMDGVGASPFMLFAVPVRPAARPRIPAVTHVDGTARVQTVSRETSPLFWRLLRRVGDRTGIPVVLNTSFNVRDEPIVCTPQDALRCFLGTGIDLLAIGRWVVEKVPA
jgi:carbamoyltransferase